MVAVQLFYRTILPWMAVIHFVFSYCRMTKRKTFKSCVIYFYQPISSPAVVYAVFIHPPLPVKYYERLPIGVYFSRLFCVCMCVIRLVNWLCFYSHITVLVFKTCKWLIGQFEWLYNAVQYIWNNHTEENCSFPYSGFTVLSSSVWLLLMWVLYLKAPWHVFCPKIEIFLLCSVENFFENAIIHLLLVTSCTVITIYIRG